MKITQAFLLITKPARRDGTAHYMKDLFTITVNAYGLITISVILFSVFIMGYAFAKGWSKKKENYNDFLNKPHAEG